MSSSVLRSRALQLGHLLKFTHFKEPRLPLQKPHERTREETSERTVDAVETHPAHRLARHATQYYPSRNMEKDGA
jgi:hypothetical protein